PRAGPQGSCGRGDRLPLSGHQESRRAVKGPRPIDILLNHRHAASLARCDGTVKVVDGSFEYRKGHDA
ncbi:MAG: hypothetical protein ACK55I_28005, partial [bacterium]